VKLNEIEGGMITALDGRFRPRQMAWMKWSEREKLRARHQAGAYEKPGERVIWKDGEDWHPRVYEAWRLAGCKTYGQFTIWCARPYGLGKPCPHIGRVVRCQSVPIANFRGSDIVACAGNDLRDIAEHLTGKRPEAPPRPKSSPPARARQAKRSDSRVSIVPDENAVMVCGVCKKVRFRQRQIVAVLLEVGKKRMILSELARRTSDDADKILRRMRDADPDWAKVIHCPGDNRGVGYGIF
jgi:hypothetical protein